MILLLFAALLLGVDVQSTVDIKQVLVDQHQCGQTVTLSLYDNYDTVRVFATDDRPCMEDVFECEVTIQMNYFPKTVKLCVDISRVKPNGANTSLSLLSQSVFYDGDITRELTHANNPSADPYMSSVICEQVKFVTLRFRYACDRNLSEAFPSWIYVYTRWKSKPHIYYVDGSCNHKLRLNEPERVSVRSVLWGNTVGEPEVQKCTLEVEVMFFDVSIDGTRKLCPSWNFTGGGIICGSSVGYLEDHSFFRSKKQSWHAVATCYDKNIAELNKCETVYFGSDVKLQVTRDRGKEESVDLKSRDQYMFRMMLRVEQPQKQDSYARWDSDDIDTTYSSDSSEDDTEMGPITKLFFALASVGAVFCCLCSIAKKLSRNREGEGAVVMSEQQSERFIPRRDPFTYQETVGMGRVPHRPRHLNQMNRQPSTTVNDSRRSMDDLSDLRSADSSLLEEVEVSGTRYSTPRREPSAPPSPVPTQIAENAPPSYEDVARTAPAAPPPAYTDLFPSRNSVQ